MTTEGRKGFGALDGAKACHIAIGSMSSLWCQVSSVGFNTNKCPTLNPHNTYINQPTERMKMKPDLNFDNLDIEVTTGDDFVIVTDGYHAQLNFDVDFLMLFTSDRERAIEMLSRVATAFDNHCDNMPIE